MLKVFFQVVTVQVEEVVVDMAAVVAAMEAAAIGAKQPKHSSKSM